MGFTIPIYFLTASLNYPTNDLFCENFFYTMLSKIFSNYSIFSLVSERFSRKRRAIFPRSASIIAA